MSNWPPLPLAAWRDTCETLHRCTQIAGKIRLALTPLTNHFWNVALHLTARGLTTRPMPFGDRTFELDFDFVDHQIVARASDGAVRRLALAPRPVEEYYRELMALVGSLGVRVAIDDRPVEIPGDRLPFHRDRVHDAYDAEAAARWFAIVRRVAVVLEEFRARFVGKASPVHFFWGSFDLSASRYSGRRAPERPGADPITREAYSHETSSVGFWPGDDRFPEPAFFAYHAPAPDGFADARVRPPGAFWHAALGEFLLPYEAVRLAGDPRAALLDFCQSTYEAGATLAGWPRAELERATEPARPAPAELHDDGPRP
ncbi:MAG TPA: DUF5996 family protein [Polyangia bacterium]|nr:DUF5996 family protein [Polyangia bacterium]